jgi:beta-lactamase superfamily II metal-dependent hydrolase
MSPMKRMGQPEMQPPESGVTVRMYDPGFGDCFLLALRAEDGSPRYMLIDCGVHQRYPGGKERMQLVAADIAKATGNHLHVVAATHEHTDHLSGFVYGKESFDNIEIDDLWLAWTEDPTDPVAKHLKQIYGLQTRAVAAAVNQLRLTDESLAEALQAVLDFDFPPNALASATAVKVRPLEYLRTKTKNKLTRSEDYRRPGEEPLTLPGVKGFKIYVLGPPKDEEFINILNTESELYPEMTAMMEAGAFPAAALCTAEKDFRDDKDSELFSRSCPFDESIGISRDLARGDSKYGRFFCEYYGFSNSSTHGQKWRRIDSDWLGAAEQLALAINNRTNNTSLVLLMEMTETEPHKTLLFAGDAQVGNWLSWDKLSWPDKGTGHGTVTVVDLLRRTALYKVGHHGSRNATLMHKGLELMESRDLVAMLPVNQLWAKKIHWKHPAEKLLERLKAKTRGRIIRTDGIPSGDKRPSKPDEVTDKEWESFVTRLDWDRSPDRLWVQYTIPG